MLSYRHAFHAGNHADVLKHCVLMLVLEYMKQKDKPFLYVDTHAGAGLYDLHGDWAKKTRDYDTGIGRIWQSGVKNAPEAMRAYLQAIESLNPQGELNEYPGSPWLAQFMLREQDRARLFELHTKEYQLLSALFARDKQIKTELRDGFQALSAVLPPPERRAVILVDPPYEVKADYQTVIESLKTAHKKFSTGVYLLWYPVVNRKYVNSIERELIDSGIRNILLAELAIGPDAEDAGMTASGMIVINPPWQLHE
ncbi:MAG: 23S rRNA (adenine(2030)-N(6))-methyltransferase RlmJ, partial [Gammaproteobacteria bacterium]|nr:23S rRNA (adenine(2030)-N(6))-methyltransferase RlmJ [Gammaproteobacteria bacterium]